MKGEDLKEYVMRFKRETVLIPDLQDGIAYTTFLNGLLPGRFKFSLGESKVAILANALRRAQDFIQAMEICARDEFIPHESRKRLGEDRDEQPNKRPKWNKERRGCFHSSPQIVLMEIKGNPLL